MFYFYLTLMIIISLTISTYNKLILKIESIKNAQNQIYIQLDRRNKIFDSLVNITNHYIKHEKNTLKDISFIRSNIKQNNNIENQTKIDDKINSIIKNLNIQIENYPILNSYQHILNLQEEIQSTENKLSYAKQYYNDVVENYISYKNKFLVNIFTKIFKKTNQQFIYWTITKKDNINYLENKRMVIK